MRRDAYRNLAFVIPLLVVFIALIVYPLFQTFQLSFYKVSLSGEKRFVGVRNYVKFFTSSYSKEVLGNTLLWTIGGVILKVGIGLGVALVLNKSFKGKTLFMSIVLLPWAIPYTISAITGRWMYNPLYGHLNRILFDLNFIKTPLEWLSDPKFALWGVLLINSWTGFPFCAFSILSGLYAVPKELYEAASIDGASGFQSFIYITLPCIRPVLVLVSVLTGMWTFNSFGFIYVMTKGGPVHSSETLVISVYRNMFEYSRPGYGSAIAVFGFVVLILFSCFTSIAVEEGRNLASFDKNGSVKYMLGKVGLIILIAVIAVICMLPPFVIVSTSLKELRDVFKIPADWMPNPVKWSNYAEIWDKVPMLQWLYNSTVVALGTILLCLVIAIPAGYAFARLRFPGKNVMIMTTLLTQMFSPVIIIGPLFSLFKTLNLLDSHVGLIISNTAFSLAFSTLLMSSFFEMMPRELEDAALIDGCGRLQSLLKIFIPLASSGIFVVSIYIFIQAWNSFLFAFTFISSSEKDILIVGIYKMVQLTTGQMPKWNYIMVTSVYSSIPITILFFVRRRTLARGLTAGAIR